MQQMQQEKQKRLAELRELDVLYIHEQLAAEDCKELEVAFPEGRFLISLFYL